QHSHLLRSAACAARTRNVTQLRLSALSFCCSLAQSPVISRIPSARELSSISFREKTMSAINRRDFLTTSASIGALSALSYTRAADAPNEKVVLAVIGIGSTVPGSVGGRGRQLIRPLTNFKDAEIAYVCDVDENFFPIAQKLLTDRKQ